MKKILTLLALAAGTMMGTAQVTVTYQVDITNYLTGATPLASNGMRVGGNFADLGTTVAQWNPSDTTCGMTNIGNNVWSIDVVYPSAQVGATQLFKFVNGNWGTNEGTDPNNTLVSGGCAVADPGGNINRELVIPASNVTLRFCYDQCTQCDGSSPILSLEETVSLQSITVFPNPAINNVSFDLNLNKAGEMEIAIVDLNGRVVKSHSASFDSGNNRVNMEIAALETGFYTYRILSSGETIRVGKLIKN